MSNFRPFASHQDLKENQTHSQTFASQPAHVDFGRQPFVKKLTICQHKQSKGNGCKLELMSFSIQLSSCCLSLLSIIICPLLFFPPILCKRKRPGRTMQQFFFVVIFVSVFLLHFCLLLCLSLFLFNQAHSLSIQLIDKQWNLRRSEIITDHHPDGRVSQH